MCMQKDDKNLMVLIGKNVRRYRLRIGLSQEKLAEQADFHSTYVEMIERAERKISIVAAERLARALGVTLNDLVKENYE